MRCSRGSNAVVSNNFSSILNGQYLCPSQGSLLVGGPGTAKTTVVNSFLSRFSPDSFSSKTITFSSLSTPAIFQVSVEVSNLLKLFTVLGLGPIP